MKITIWIRKSENEDDVPVVRLDFKNETRDTPQISRYGRKIMDAIEGGDSK